MPCDPTHDSVLSLAIELAGIEGDELVHGGPDQGRFYRNLVQTESVLLDGHEKGAGISPCSANERGYKLKNKLDGGVPIENGLHPVKNKGFATLCIDLDQIDPLVCLREILVQRCRADLDLVDLVLVMTKEFLRDVDYRATA
jgi:hypothetical protein